MSAVVILMRVFGKKPGQTTGEFAKEAKEVSKDLVFVQECLEYGLANGILEAGTTLTEVPA